jgi:hypothetical protein
METRAQRLGDHDVQAEQEPGGRACMRSPVALMARKIHGHPETIKAPGPGAVP